MKSILIIDDDKKLNELLNEYFTKNGYKSTAVVNAKDGMSKLRNHHFDLIIHDVMLPEINGFDSVKEIRKHFEIPILMLTARGEVTDRIVGLELGADDYMPKPFEPRELLARIQSILRRTEMKLKKNEIIRLKVPAGELSIDSNKRSASLNEKDLELTSTEFDMLILFAANNGKVLSREEIMQSTKGISWMSFDRSVDVMVSRLRNKLKGNKKKKENAIRTVHSVGYIFYAEDESK